MNAKEVAAVITPQNIMRAFNLGELGGWCDRLRQNVEVLSAPSTEIARDGDGGEAGVSAGGDEGLREVLEKALERATVQQTVAPFITLRLDIVQRMIAVLSRPKTNDVPGRREAVDALQPFAKLAGPINGEDGRPTYLEAIGGPNGTDELVLSTHVGDGTRIEILDAEDFRRAREVLDLLTPPNNNGSAAADRDGGEA